NAFGVYVESAPLNVMLPFVFTYICVCVRSKNRMPLGNTGVMSIARDEPSSLGPRHDVPYPTTPPKPLIKVVCACTVDAEAHTSSTAAALKVNAALESF